VERRPARVVPLVVAAALLAGACAAVPPAPEPTLDISAASHPYFELVRRQIRPHWAFPCVTNTATGVCQYKEAHVGLEFGILPDGSLRYVDVTQSSGYALYDDRAVDAVRRAAPFPPVPDDVMARQPTRSAAVAVHAQFNYVVK